MRGQLRRRAGRAATGSLLQGADSCWPDRGHRVGQAEAAAWRAEYVHQVHAGDGGADGEQRVDVRGVQRQPRGEHGRGGSVIEERALPVRHPRHDDQAESLPAFAPARQPASGDADPPAGGLQLGDRGEPQRRVGVGQLGGRPSWAARSAMIQTWRSSGTVYACA